MATPKQEEEKRLELAVANHDAILKEAVHLPEELNKADKQPQAAAYIINSYVTEQALATREELLFIWAGYTGAQIDPTIRQLIQAIDILNPRQ